MMTSRSKGGSQTAGAVLALALVAAVSAGTVRPAHESRDAERSRAPIAAGATAQATPDAYHHFGVPVRFTPDAYHHFP